MASMACLRLLSHEHQAAIEERKQGVDDHTAFVGPELVFVKEHPAATD